MKRYLISLSSLLLIAQAGCGHSLPPAPKAYFNDYAGVVTPSVRDSLNERLKKFDQETTNQIVVAIFPKMDSPLSVEDYTLQVANSWKVGQKGKDNGVILFIFMQNHAMRIQVGYGLSTVLTDELSKKILVEDMTPRFVKNDFDGGLAAGVDSILKIVSGKAPAGKADSR